METLSQKEIAEKAGISRSFLCDILHARKTPRPVVAKRLEKVTGVNVLAWLMPQDHYNALIHKVMGKQYSYPTVENKAAEQP